MKFDQVGPDEWRICGLQDAAKAGFREDRTRGGLRSPNQLPGAAGEWSVVAWGVGRGHVEISGSATGLTSRPSGEMSPNPSAGCRCVTNCREFPIPRMSG
jgi:hypothetical protein